MSEGKCPHCGGTGGVTTKEYASGFITRFVYWDGKTDDYSSDDLNLRRPKTGICSDCGRRVPNPSK